MQPAFVCYTWGTSRHDSWPLNDLLSQLPSETIVSYADDTVILCNDDSWNKVQSRMNYSLKCVGTWLAVNQLSLNVLKTVYIAFGAYCDSVPDFLNIRINDQQIKRVESCKYLGVYIDYKVRWDVHIENVVKKTKYLLFIFKKLAKLMHPRSMLSIYYALFHSICHYGIIAWGRGVCIQQCKMCIGCASEEDIKNCSWGCIPSSCSVEFTSVIYF